MSVGRDEGRLRCPSGKRELLLAAMAELLAELTERTRVPWRQARAVVGKVGQPRAGAAGAETRAPRRIRGGAPGRG
eukprot:6182274-Pleurochrysis_carterae.AAC.1